MIISNFISSEYMKERFRRKHDTYQDTCYLEDILKYFIIM